MYLSTRFRSHWYVSRSLRNSSQLHIRNLRHLSVNTDNEPNKEKFDGTKNQPAEGGLPSATKIGNRIRLVVLGCGWGGFRIIRDIDPELYEVCVISPRNHMLFTPLLASTAVGTLESRSICEPIRPWIRKKNGLYYQAVAVDVDTSSRMVTCSTIHHDMPNMPDRKFKVYYDKLVVAVGTKVNDYGIPGVNEHALYMKETNDAQIFRREVLKRLEQASHPGLGVEEIRNMMTFVVVGGGPTGIELSAEIADFFEQDCRRTYPEIYPHMSVIVVEGGTILSMFQKSLREYTIRRFRRRKIDVELGDGVKEITKDNLVLKSGKKIPYGAVVWCAGIKCRETIKSWDFPRDDVGRILTDDFLKIKGCENEYAVGDCQLNPETPLVPTGAVANKQGKYLAQTLNDVNKKEAVEFQFSGLGMMTYVGGWSSIIQTEHSGGFMRGFFSYLTWRSVYLTMQGSWRNRFMIPFDWTKSLFFGRDITRI